VAQASPSTAAASPTRLSNGAQPLPRSKTRGSTSADLVMVGFLFMSDGGASGTAENSPGCSPRHRSRRLARTGSGEIATPGEKGKVALGFGRTIAGIVTEHPGNLLG
jgi:hypothetical protein